MLLQAERCNAADLTCWFDQEWKPLWCGCLISKDIWSAWWSDEAVQRASTSVCNRKSPDSLVHERLNHKAPYPHVHQVAQNILDSLEERLQACSCP